ncbi:LytR/AlgR family response regulator transcription factor [Dyadobacter sediminis]|uniref:Response regulator transcription factor n=1 Tax=Dyadobacter sediminis TaxID=1493691 RepID=A0A5R9K7G8_9BACT|nr:LytTR family DNA-binding domain-containing protein [Dyadobacter sediminis]TLU89791.1 response regulator transcription factor [Dyadobacter sediminis]GGC12789.1 DNA-binding response regulator [Dyadobacter sediminis]
MIKVLIIDEEVKARNILNYYIIHFLPVIAEIRQAASATEAQRILSDFQPDIVFLDIRMPDQDGFDFLAGLNDSTFEIIFTTAYNHYAIQAIRFSALDYLLKPVDPDELIKVVLKLIDKQDRVRKKPQLYQNLIHNMEKKNIEDFRLAVPSEAGIFFFHTFEILHIQSIGKCSLIYLEGKKSFLSSRSLGHYEDMLDQFNFIRTHKAHLINPVHIASFGKNNEYVILSDGSKAEISRRKKRDLQQYYRID